MHPKYTHVNQPVASPVDMLLSFLTSVVKKEHGVGRCLVCQVGADVRTDASYPTALQLVWQR